MAKRMAAATIVLLATVASLAAQSELSKAQQAVVAQKIAKLSAQEKKIVAEWSDGYKLTEYFCKDAARAELKKTVPQLGRVFLGTDEESIKRFKVEGNTKVSGEGQLQNGPTWKDFTFACALDAEKASVKSFTFSMK